MNHFPAQLLKEACLVRQRGPCVRALCEAVAVLLSKNMTCARPRCSATPSKHFPHTSHCTLHTSHVHFSSTHLIWAILISFHVFPYVCYVLLGYFHVIWAQLKLSHLTGASFNSSRLFCTSESLRHKAQQPQQHPEIAAPKPELDATTVKRRFCSTF